MDEKTEIVFSEQANDSLSEIAHVDFDLLDINGRWLLKVLSGPNTGAEFSMQGDTSYVIGTDPQQCDIIFQDLSVSRQHAKLIIDKRDQATLQDLGSRNGTFVDGQKITELEITGNALVLMGTTTFLLIDRDAERTTIVAPRLHASLFDGSGTTVGGNALSNGDTSTYRGESLQDTFSSDIELSQNGSPVTDQVDTPHQILNELHSVVMAPLQSEVDKVKEEEKRQNKITHMTNSLAILAIITGFILCVGVGTTFLFKTEEIQTPKIVDADTEITARLKEFPAIRYSYNPASNRLLLIGHVLTSVDRSRMMDALQQLKFITNIDYNNVVIDELVYRELNQVLSKNPQWKGISISSPQAGSYILSGFLKTKDQANDLYDYITQNFPYVDLLQRRVVVEEDVLAQVTKALLSQGFRGIQTTLNNGELILKGSIPAKQRIKYDEIIKTFQSINGVRSVQSFIDESGKNAGFIDLTGKYRTTGYSQTGSIVSVVINGRILSAGDTIDGMIITSITPTTVFLQRELVKYKIEINR